MTHLRIQWERYTCMLKFCTQNVNDPKEHASRSYGELEGQTFQRFWRASSSTMDGASGEFRQSNGITEIVVMVIFWKVKVCGKDKVGECKLLGDWRERKLQDCGRRVATVRIIGDRDSPFCLRDLALSSIIERNWEIYFETGRYLSRIQVADQRTSYHFLQPIAVTELHCNQLAFLHRLVATIPHQIPSTKTQKRC